MSAADKVKDYLGHPSEAAIAFERFDDVDLKAARGLEDRDLGRQIGIRVNEIMDRLMHLDNALVAMLDHIKAQSDSDSLGALTTLAQAYALDTSNNYFALAAHILAAVERGRLVSAAEVGRDGGEAPDGEQGRAPGVAEPNDATSVERTLTVARFDLVGDALGRIDDLARELREKHSLPELVEIEGLANAVIACTDSCGPEGDEILTKALAAGPSGEPGLMPTSETAAPEEVDADYLGQQIAYEVDAIGGGLADMAPPHFTAQGEGEYRMRLQMRSTGMRLKQLAGAHLALLEPGNFKHAKSEVFGEVFGEEA